MTDINEDWCAENPAAALREIENLQQRFDEVAELLERLRDGRDVILPQNHDHASYMNAVALAYLDKLDA